MKINLLGQTLGELQELCIGEGFPRFTAKQLCDWLYKKRVDSIDAMTNLSLSQRARLNEIAYIGREMPMRCAVSKDGTKKYLFPVLDGHYIEAVYIPDDDRATLCVSCQVALAFVEETFQAWDYSYRADGYTLGTPAQAPVGRHRLCGGKHGVEVVHRFAHTHEDYVGELLEFRNAEELVEDVAGGEVSVEALLAGDAEAATHLAAHLAAHAQRSAIFLGDKDRLDEVAV